MSVQSEENLFSFFEDVGKVAHATTEHSLGRLNNASGLDTIPDLVGSKMNSHTDSCPPHLNGAYFPIHFLRNCWEGKTAKHDGHSRERSSPTLHLLRERVLGAMEEGESLAGKTSYFLPQSSLDNLFTSTIVKETLLETGCSINDDLSSAVVKNYRRIFAILVMISKPSAMLKFVDHDVDDACLPFTLDNVHEDAATALNNQPNRRLSPLQTLGGETVKEFLKWQYIINPPHMQLAYDGASQGWKYECFHEHTILPFTHVEQSNSGGYGTIYRVRVHPDNHRGVESFQVRERASVCYAVKKLRSTDERDFLREFNILREVSRTPHANIVTILGSFRLGQDYHLVFPWADCDLSTFWRLNQKPEMDEKHVTWHVNLCLDIAKGLDFLHRSLSIVHGDIKPANILCFGKGEYPVAKIADLGSALVGVPRRKTVQPDEVLQTTPVYRAPECDLEPRKISRAVDIWSMGCIMLESVAWLVSGSAGLDKLADLRRDAWPGDPSRDAFFNYAESDGVLRAEVKPQILNWTSAISTASAFLTDIVELVLENMLTFRKEDDMFGRLSSHVLCEALSKIRRKMDRNDAYYEPRGSLDMVHSDRSTAGGQGANRKRASTSEVSATRENKTKRKMTDETDMNDGLTDRFVLREKFACPFWKAGVDKVFLNRACAGPGWDEVHRVKEHIRRCHTPSSFKNPYVCGRCLENFGSQERLMQHGREEIQCIIRAPEIIHGKITLEQAINLRSTKKKAPDMTDEEKWFDWFSILLPAHPLPLSPYYDDATSSTLNTLSTQHSTGISEYEEYLHIPLDDEKQKDLEEDIGGALGITNTAMCRILATKFREYQLRDVQKFNQDKLKPTYEIPALSNDLEKEHDYVSDVGATVSAELDIALAEWLA